MLMNSHAFKGTLYVHRKNTIFLLEKNLHGLITIKVAFVHFAYANKPFFDAL